MFDKHTDDVMFYVVIFTWLIALLVGATAYMSL